MKTELCKHRQSRKGLAFALGFGLLAALPMHGEVLFEWFGRDAFDDGQRFAPSVVEGDLGRLKELEFEPPADAGNPGPASYLEIPLSPGDIEELTIAFYIRPERRDQNEDIVTSKFDVGKGGFRFRKNWMRWGLDVGDGDQSIFVNVADRGADLSMGEWQHLAVTFNRGELTFYKDGLVVDRQTVDVKRLRIPDKAKLHIGSGQGQPGQVYDAFAGRLGGIYVSTNAADERQIKDLMRRGNPANDSSQPTPTKP